MTTASLEQRVKSLESRFAELLEMFQEQPARNAWRSVVGMFADDPQIHKFHKETQRIREQAKIGPAAKEAVPALIAALTKEHVVANDADVFAVVQGERRLANSL